MISSQLEIIAQGKIYLKNISKKDYSAILRPLFISSSGAHIRHIVDHYRAIMMGVKQGEIDYDIRNRGEAIELSPVIAIEKLDEIAFWINTLTTDDLHKTLVLSTEVSIKNKNVQTVTTSLARELVFAGSHAIHHYAMIAQITMQQKGNLPSTFGLAPATATFLREQNELGKNTNASA